MCRVRISARLSSLFGAFIYRKTATEDIISCMALRRTYIGVLACVFACCAAIGSDTAVALEHGWVPNLTGWVNDTAGVLTKSDRERIAGTLQRYHLETHHQIAILIIPSLGEEQIETFSLRTANAWALGNKGYDDGILVTLAMK